MTGPEALHQPARRLVLSGLKRPVLGAVLVLGLVAAGFLQPSMAASEAALGIRDARNECAVRGGQFWRTGLGYGCNSARRGQDFHCHSGTCRGGAMTTREPRRPGDFGGEIIDSGPGSGRTN